VFYFALRTSIAPEALIAADECVGLFRRALELK